MPPDLSGLFFGEKALVDFQLEFGFPQGQLVTHVLGLDVFGKDASPYPSHFLPHLHVSGPHRSMICS
jgi:hypothetical protein